MEIKRKSRVVVTTERKLVFRRSGFDSEVRCEKCGEQMITVQDMALIKGISTRDIYRLVEKGFGHFLETEEKVVYVCQKIFDSD